MIGVCVYLHINPIRVYYTLSLLTILYICLSYTTRHVDYCGGVEKKEQQNKQRDKEEEESVPNKLFSFGSLSKKHNPSCRYIPTQSIQIFYLICQVFVQNP